MKVNYLQESVFGKYKKLSKEEKMQTVRKIGQQASNKWFRENVFPKILDYYIPTILEYSHTICKQERGISILYDISRRQEIMDRNGVVVDINEVNGKIIIRQYVIYCDAASWNNLYFLKNETFEIFDEIEEYINEHFGEYGKCEIKLVLSEIVSTKSWITTIYNSDQDKIKEIPFLQGVKNEILPEIIISNKEIKSLDKVFKFFNRFEKSLPILPSLSLSSCNSLTSFNSKIPLKNFKVKRIYLWGGANLKSFNGWNKFMVDDDPTVIYNVNSILDNTAASHIRYEIKKEFDVDKPAFELATNGKIPKKYLLYLSEIKRQQLEKYNRALKTHKSEDDVEDLDIEGAKITFLEYHLKTEKVKQYEHDPLQFMKGDTVWG